MSQEDVEFLQEASDALRSGDMERVETVLKDVLAPAFEYRSLALDQRRPANLSESAR